MEKRLKPHQKKSSAKSKGVLVPIDYIQMVVEVLTNTFSDGILELSKTMPSPRFLAKGTIYDDEIIFSVEIGTDKKLSSTTVHASADFDPKASSPKAETLLGDCVDAIGSFYSQYLLKDSERKPEDLIAETLSAMEGVPFQWTQFKVGKRQVYLMVDKTNIGLDERANEILKKAGADPDIDDDNSDDF